MTSSPPIRLNVLDQSPIRPGATPRQALLETVELAQLADRLGYTRFWVSEHHNTNTLAGSTPEVLLAHLGNHTRHIRLGSGGIMLPHYSALKVAENFRMLESLFPGRIDLGMGRAPGADRLTAYALNPNNQFNEKDFVEQLMDLQAYRESARHHPRAGDGHSAVDHRPGAVDSELQRAERLVCGAFGHGVFVCPVH
jgi:luciferase family oxidoreductase group 1